MLKCVDSFVVRVLLQPFGGMVLPLGHTASADRGRGGAAHVVRRIVQVELQRPAHPYHAGARVCDWRDGAAGRGRQAPRQRQG
eukprot:6253527-Pyramimonas_sp.AAC.1